MRLYLHDHNAGPSGWARSTNGPDNEADVGLSSAFGIDSLKAAGTFLGIIGSGGGGFAALSFGIGYLAIKKHDELIGLPTTVSDPTSYIRTGALFFSNSAYFLLAATYRFLVFVALIGLLVALFFSVARNFRCFRSTGGHRKVRRSAPSQFSGWLVPMACTLLLVAALCALALQTATFDPQNRNLLYQVISDREAKLSRAPDTPLQNDLATTAKVLVWPPWRQPLATRINVLLRHPQGRELLQLFYGQQFALVLAIIFGAIAFRLKRKKWGPEVGRLSGVSQEWRPYRLTQILTPFVYLVVLALVINLPAAYGVLCLPTNAALVRVSVVGSKRTVSGLLLSDLSSGSREIWLLGERQRKFFLTVLERSTVSDIVLRGEITDNFLAVEDPR